MRWLLVCSLLWLQGCSSMQVEDYRHTTPVLDLFDFFNGQTMAWGQFQDRSGKVVRRFQVKIAGEVTANQLVLDEQFFYDDGERQQRIWTIKQTDDNQFLGTAADVVGEAKGVSAGNALNWRYTLALPYQGSVYNVKFDDWMFLNTPNTMINRAKVTKFGFLIGEVTLFFEKQ